MMNPGERESNPLGEIVRVVHYPHAVCGTVANYNLRAGQALGQVSCIGCGELLPDEFTPVTLGNATRARPSRIGGLRGFLNSIGRGAGYVAAGLAGLVALALVVIVVVVIVRHPTDSEVCEKAYGGGWMVKIHFEGPKSCILPGVDDVELPYP
jgi:hypothetical protein